MAVDAAIRTAAISAHGETWRLLEKPSRTGAEDAAMVAAARSSLENWLRVGAPVNEQRGVWLLARVQVDVGDQRAALEYAVGTLALTERHRNALQDFDLAFAEEIAARAFALAGNLSRAAEHYRKALVLGKAIKEDDERKIFFDQLESGPWFGVEG